MLCLSDMEMREIQNLLTTKSTTQKPLCFIFYEKWFTTQFEWRI